MKILATLLISTLAFACTSSRPSPELINARTAYREAANSNATAMVPAELHVAKTALDRAEREAADESMSPAARDLAYIAQRKAQRAQALGNAAAAVAATAAFEAERVRTQDTIIANQQGQLRSTEGKLDRKQTELERKQGELAQQKAETATERNARVAAETKAAESDKKAKDAMDALGRQMAIKDDPRGTVITLSGGVLFVTGKATLLLGATSQLDKVADALSTQAERHFTIEGHTDSTGSVAVNASLSARRANAVRDYLISRGVAADAISAIGIGSGRPVADNKSTEGRAMNRRVEIIVDRSTSTNAAAQK